jgi:hypothetical protein
VPQECGTEGIQVQAGFHAGVLNPRTRVLVRIAQDVRPGEAGYSGAAVVELREYGIRMSGLRTHDPRDSNLFQGLAQYAAVQIPLAGPKGKLIREIYNPALTNIVIGVPSKGLVGIP